jgi:UDP-N-acetyl-2-amino-2-deoxyglucuronate dehydrogenase
VSQAAVTIESRTGQSRRTLRIGLIGCGERGAALGPLVGRTRSARLTMVMDTNPALAADLGDRLQIPWSVELDEVLSSEAVDAVIISTPHHLHAPQALRAAAAGKHIMIEKPLAASLKDAVAVVRAARDAGVQVSTILPYRYIPRVQKAKALVRAGAVGDLFGVSLVYQDDRFADYWRRGHKGRTLSDWRMRWETAGGGILITTVIHHLDWLRYVPGLEITEVSAKYATFDSPGEVEDSISMWVRYENGAHGTVTVGSSVRGTDIMDFRLWGRDGHLSLSEFYSLRLIDGKRPGQWHALPETKSVVHRDVEYVERFCDHVLAEQPLEITAEDGLAVQAIIDAAYRSSRTGCVEKVEQGPW